MRHADTEVPSTWRLPASDSLTHAATSPVSTMVLLRLPSRSTADEVLPDRSAGGEAGGAQHGVRQRGSLAVGSGGTAVPGVDDVEPPLG